MQSIHDAPDGYVLASGPPDDLNEAGSLELGGTSIAGIGQIETVMVNGTNMDFMELLQTRGPEFGFRIGITEWDIENEEDSA